MYCNKVNVKREVQKLNHIFLSSLLIISAILLSNLVIYGIRKRTIPGVFFFSILMLAMVIHTMGYAFELLGGSVEQMYFWIKVEYIGVSFYPFLIMLFARGYADEKKFANKYILTLMLTINMATLVFVYTNVHHWLYYASIGVDYSPGFAILALKKGIWYYMQVISLYTSVLYSVIVFSIMLKKTRGDYQKKVVYMLIGVLIPLLTMVIYMVGLGPIYIDLTPFSYFLMSIFIIIGLLRYDILILTPITHETVFNAIGEAVLVLDRDKLLINFNNASKEFFPSLARIKMGDAIYTVEELKDYDFSCGPPLYEINGKILLFKKIELANNKVSIFVVNDITESERVKKQLEILATEDALTGLYNRRFFMEKMNENIEEGTFVIMDVDYFKSINDSFGHVAGDKVLSYFGQEIKNFFGEQLACRYGGEEFAIFMERLELEEAFQLVERFREQISRTSGEIRFTFSAGMAKCRRAHVEEALVHADQKLYEAKDNGRNQTCY